MSSIIVNVVLYVHDNFCTYLVLTPISSPPIPLTRSLSPPKSLSSERFKKLLKDQIEAKQRVNIVQSRKSELLEASLHRYQNQVISVTAALQELIHIAQDVGGANERGEELRLEPYELAFYDALAHNHSAQEVMGIEQLLQLVRVLVERSEQNTSIDWKLWRSS